MATYSASQASGYVMEVYAYFDMMLVLHQNNQIELIF